MTCVRRSVNSPQKYKTWQTGKPAKFCAGVNTVMRKITSQMDVGAMLPETASDYTNEQLHTAFIKGIRQKEQKSDQLIFQHIMLYYL